MNYVQMINAWDMSKEKDITTIIVFSSAEIAGASL